MYSLKLPLFGNNSKIPLVPDVHCICLYFMIVMVTNQIHITFGNLGEGIVVFYFSVKGSTWGTSHLKNISNVQKIE